MCAEIIIIAMLMMLLDTKIVANKYFTFFKCLIIICCFVFFNSDKSDGFNEKKATSDPEISPEHIISIIQDIKSI